MISVGLGSRYNKRMDNRAGEKVPLTISLTQREQDILASLGDGLTNRQITERYTLALSTVKWYLRQIYNKLGVSNRQEAVSQARLLGLLSP